MSNRLKFNDLIDLYQNCPIMKVKQFVELAGTFTSSRFIIKKEEVSVDKSVGGFQK